MQYSSTVSTSLAPKVKCSIHEGQVTRNHCAASGDFFSSISRANLRGTKYDFPLKTISLLVKSMSGPFDGVFRAGRFKPTHASRIFGGAGPAGTLVTLMSNAWNIIHPHAGHSSVSGSIRLKIRNRAWQFGHSPGFNSVFFIVHSPLFL